MKFYRLALLKSYFDTGYAFTSYLKYMIAFFGITSGDIKTTMILGIIYGFSCFFLGWIAYSSGFIRAQAEVANQYNAFVSEMREKLKK